jgi:alpha-1,6-mannosyltransferase
MMVMKGKTVWPKVVCSVVGLFHLLACPYSKVEESFHVQATHDIYYFGVTPAISAFSNTSGNHNTTTTILPYDHLEYPGVVPRTFLGSFLLAKLCSIVGWVVPLNPHHVGMLARLILLGMSLYQLFGLADAIQDEMVGSYLLWIAASQFHGMFYASRLLSNTFATILTTRCYAHWFRNNDHRNNKNNHEMTRAAMAMVWACCCSVVECPGCSHEP